MPGCAAPSPRSSVRDMERLQKILSTAGVASRRTAEELIRQGRVSVNGRTVTELGTKADPAADEIKVDGPASRPRRRCATCSSTSRAATSPRAAIPRSARR